MRVIANQSIAHGAFNMHRGDEADMPDAVAADLIKAGFVKEVGGKKAPAADNKMAAQPENKAKK